MLNDLGSRFVTVLWYGNDIILQKKYRQKELETHGLWLWVLWWFLRQFLCGLLRFPDVHCVKYNGVNFIMKYVVNPHKAAEILANCWWDLRLGEGGVYNVHSARGQENVRNRTQIKLYARGGGWEGNWRRGWENKNPHCTTKTHHQILRKNAHEF